MDSIFMCSSIFSIVVPPFTCIFSFTDHQSEFADSRKKHDISWWLSACFVSTTLFILYFGFDAFANKSSRVSPQ